MGVSHAVAAVQCRVLHGVRSIATFILYAFFVLLPAFLFFFSLCCLVLFHLAGLVIIMIVCSSFFPIECCYLYCMLYSCTVLSSSLSSQSGLFCLLLGATFSTRSVERWTNTASGNGLTV